MMDLNKDFREFIAALNANDVDYLLVGGYAVGFHGYPRFTQDLDIWVRPTEKNARKVLQALIDFGFPSTRLTINDFLSPDTEFQMGYPPFRMDVMNSIEGVQFENCFKRRSYVDFDGVSISVIGLNDLKKNKKATGRKKDLVDIEHLKK